MVPRGRPPVAIHDSMALPVAGTADDLALEEQACVVARVFKWHEQQVHRVWLARGGERESWQERDGLAALFEENGKLVHGFESREFPCGIVHDEPPQGTWLKNFMPSLITVFWPGSSGTSSPSAFRTLRRYPASTPRTPMSSSVV